MTPKQARKRHFQWTKPAEVPEGESSRPPQPKAKKPWKIERRYVGGQTFFSQFYTKEWETFRKYEKPQDAIKALKSMKLTHRISGDVRFEARIIDPDGNVADLTTLLEPTP